MKPFKMTPAMRYGTYILKGLLRLGIPMGPLRLLTHIGRKSGTRYTTPVALVKQDGHRWLVAAFGEVNWVHNIRKTGTAQLSAGWRTETVSVHELAVTESAPILKLFLARYHMVPFIPPYFHATPQSPLADFAQEANDHPVFYIE